MKKILLLLAMLPMMCFGQENNLKVVDMIVEGTRIIRVSPTGILDHRQFASNSVFGEGFVVTVAPVITKTFSSYGKSNQRISYDLQIPTASPKPISIAKNARILLKKEDGTNIMLRTISSDEDNISNGDSYNILPIFGVTLAQLKEIADGGISKIRIEYTGAIKNVELKNNKLSAFVKQAIMKIEEAEKVKDAFLEGF